jgi:hypothetical protein
VAARQCDPSIEFARRDVARPHTGADGRFAPIEAQFAFGFLRTVALPAMPAEDWQNVTRKIGDLVCPPSGGTGQTHRQHDEPRSPDSFQAGMLHAAISLKGVGPAVPAGFTPDSIRESFKGLWVVEDSDASHPLWPATRRDYLAAFNCASAKSRIFSQNF